MSDWFSRLLHRSSQAAPAEELLALQNQLQTARLEIQEQNKKLAALQEELERARRQQEKQNQESLSNRLQALFNDLAAPVAQLLTQEYLVEQGKPVQNRDILSVTRRLVRALEQNGLCIEHRPGEETPFDGNRHTPLNAAQTIVAGQPVIVRFAAIAYQGRILYKAGVEEKKAG